MKKKKSTIKYRSDSPMNYQFGGLSFLDPYLNLGKQWDTFWKGDDYFSAGNPPPTGVYADPKAMLYNTVGNNTAVINAYNTNKQTLKDNPYTGEWGDDAHNYYYNKTLNGAYTDSQLSAFGNFEKQNFKGDPAGAHEYAAANNINLDQYQNWYDGRKGYANQAGALFDSERAKRNAALADQPNVNKQMGEAFTNTASGIFSGLNYQNAYKAPEPINLEKGFQGVQYAQYGNKVGQPISNYSVTSENPNKTINAFNGPLANNINFEGRGTPLDSEYNLIMTNNDVLESVIGIQGLSKNTLKKLSKNKLIDLLKVNTKPIINSTAQQGLQEGVSSWEHGGNINLTGYTPGSPTQFNKSNTIPGGDISMKDMDRDLIGIVKGGGKHGLITKLEKGKEYSFGSDSVTELPINPIKQQEMLHAQFGANIADPQQLAQYARDQYLSQIAGSAEYGPSVSTPEFNNRMLNAPKAAMHPLAGNPISTYDPSVTNSLYPQQAAYTQVLPGDNTPFSASPSNIKTNILTSKGDPWEYVKDGDVWKTRKKGGTNWITAKGDALLAIEQRFSTGGIQPKSAKSPIKKSSVSPIVQSNFQYPFLDNLNPGIPTSTSIDNKTASWSNPLQQDTNNKLASIPNMGNYKSDEINALYNNPERNLQDHTFAEGVQNKYKQNADNKYKKYSDELAIVEKDEWLSPKVKEAKIKDLKNKISTAEKDSARFELATYGEQSKQLKKNDRLVSQRISNTAKEREVTQQRLQKESKAKEDSIKSYNTYINKLSTTIDSYDRIGGEDRDGFKPLNQDGDKILKSSGGQYKLKFKGKLVDKIFDNKEEVLAEIKKRTADANTRYGNNKKYVPTYQYGGIIPNFQFGGPINNDYTYPIHPITEEFTEIQTEKGEVVALPDFTIVNVKADKSHKQVDKDDVTDILPAEAYVFSDDDKMKLHLDDKIGGVAIKDMTLGKSVFEYKENEITAGPTDVYFSKLWGKSKELTPAQLVNNVKKKFEVRDQKDDFFVERANMENKEQRSEYLDIIKALSEYKKPKSKRIPKAQYGLNVGLPKMYNQPTNNALDGIMGYTNKVMDPYYGMDNKVKNMYNISSTMDSKLFENGGEVPHAQFGFIGAGVDALFGFSKRKKEEQERLNLIDKLRYEAAVNGYVDNVKRTGAIETTGALAGYAASLNVPDLKYNDNSSALATMSDSFARRNAMLNAQKYSAINSNGAGSSMARYTTSNNDLGAYLAAIQGNTNQLVAGVNDRQIALEGERAGTLSGLESQGLDNYNSVFNNKATQIYNANVAGMGNLSGAAATANANVGQANYQAELDKLSYQQYQRDLANQAFDKSRNKIEGYANDIGNLGMFALTGGFGGGKGGDNNQQMGSTTFNGQQVPSNWDSRYTSSASQQFYPQMQIPTTGSYGMRWNNNSVVPGYSTIRNNPWDIPLFYNPYN